MFNLEMFILKLGERSDQVAESVSNFGSLRKHRVLVGFLRHLWGVTSRDNSHCRRYDNFRKTDSTKIFRHIARGGGGVYLQLTKSVSQRLVLVPSPD
jgi:hypothetical protein